MNFIYLTTNIINGKKYVGSHNGDPNDSYLGSGKILKDAIKKYGPENFKREILESCNPSLNLILEEKYINELNTLQPVGYNISPTGGYILYSEDIKNKLSESRKKHSGPNKGKKFPPETIEKMRIAQTGMKRGPRSEEVKQKISQSILGQKRSAETKQKISKSLSGRKLSDGTKKKMSEFQKGRIKSEGERKNISESKKGDKNPMYGRDPWNKGISSK